MRLFENSFLLRTIILISLFGIACALPDILVLSNPNSEMFTISRTSPVLFDEDTYYAKGASFFMTQGRLPFELEIYELRNAVTFNPPLPAVIIGSMARVLNSNLPLAWTLTHFLFPALSLLLAVRLASIFIGQNVYAWLIGLLFCTFGQSPRTFLMLSEYARAQPLLITRIEPQAIGLPLFLLFILSACYMCAGKTGIWKWLCGTAAGLQFYVYFFFWSILPIFFFVMCLLYFLVQDRSRFLNFLTSAGIAAILAIPFVMQMVFVTPSGYVKNGIGHLLNPTLFIGSAAFCFCLFLCWIAYQKSYLFLFKPTQTSGFRIQEGFLYSKIHTMTPILMVLSIAILLKYVISPYIFPLPETGHYVQRVIVGFTMFLLFCTLVRWLLARKWSRRLYSAAFVVLVVLVGYVFLKQIVFWDVHRTERTLVQREKTVEQLIRSHTQRTDVVAVGDPHYNMILPTRIHRYRFYADIARSVISPDENLKRYLFICKILGRTWEEVQDELTGRSNVARGRFIFDISVPHILAGTETVGQEELSKYAQFYEKVDGSFLQDRRLDYIIVNAVNEPAFLESSRQMGIKVNCVTSQGIVSLFRIMALNMAHNKWWQNTLDTTPIPRK